ncbi:MAG: hypothetical protein ISP72_02170 [Flavobacteriaceae bacterium]|nr:hypothetical protein [Flavobacteriaceae bacterium]
MTELLQYPHFTAAELKGINYTFKSSVDQAVDNIEFVSNVMKDDFFKMSDFERIQLIEKKEKESVQLSAQVDAKMRQYTELKDWRDFEIGIKRKAEKDRSKNEF